MSAPGASDPETFAVLVFSFCLLAGLRVGVGLFSSPPLLFSSSGDRGGVPDDPILAASVGAAVSGSNVVCCEV